MDDDVDQILVAEAARLLRRVRDIGTDLVRRGLTVAGGAGRTAARRLERATVPDFVPEMSRVVPLLYRAFPTCQSDSLASLMWS